MRQAVLGRAGMPAAPGVQRFRDVRGWGGSKKPHEMDSPAEKSTPLVSTNEAADDIETVVRWIVRRTYEKAALLGWASGGHWACAYASREPAGLIKLIVLNALYSVNAPWELRASMQDGGRLLALQPPPILVGGPPSSRNSPSTRHQNYKSSYK